MSQLQDPPSKIYTYPHTIPSEILYVSREGWVQVLRDLNVERGDQVTLKPGRIIALAIKDLEIGFIVAEENESVEYHGLNLTLFDFDFNSDVGDFYVPGQALHVYDDGASYATSVIEHIILEHWKPRAYTRPITGEDCEIEIVFEFTPVGASEPNQYVERIDLWSEAVRSED